MKAESDTMPTHPFVIDKRGDLADITFFEGVKESEREDRTVFEYDSHILTVPYRDDLRRGCGGSLRALVISRQTSRTPCSQRTNRG